MAARGLDWLVAIHPVSIHWLTGSDAKSYQEFQCLLVGARDEPLVVLTRAGRGARVRDGFAGRRGASALAAARTRIRSPPLRVMAQRHGAARQARRPRSARLLSPPASLSRPARPARAMPGRRSDRPDRRAEAGEVAGGAWLYPARGSDSPISAWSASPATSRRASRNWRWPAASTRPCCGKAAASPPARSTWSPGHARPTATAHRRSAAAAGRFRQHRVRRHLSAATPRRSAGSSCWARRRRACSNSTMSCAAPATP